MSSHRKQKLELTWSGKENRPKLDPRILLEDHAGESLQEVGGLNLPVLGDRVTLT